MVEYPARPLSPGPRSAGFEHLRRKSSPIPVAERKSTWRGQGIVYLNGQLASLQPLPFCGIGYPQNRRTTASRGDPPKAGSRSRQRHPPEWRSKAPCCCGSAARRRLRPLRGGRLGSVRASPAGRPATVLLQNRLRNNLPLGLWIQSSRLRNQATRLRRQRATQQQ
jgi:hypothetical protein